MRHAPKLALAIFFSVAAHLSAQTTQGLIAGRILNSITGRPVANATITWSSSTLAASGVQKSDAFGYYFLPLLSAGTYNLRTEADTYQPQELQELELPVAGIISLDFRLRPLNDVWEAGQYRSVFLPGTRTVVTFFGPDVDTSRSGTFSAQNGDRSALDTSQSYVVTPAQIEDLPLQGRDVYTMLISLPNVTSDTSTGRGIGVSVAGARPSSSNFLLDGVSNDNYLITGPLNPVSPEAIQEYRISTNNYSAEYGRTNGFVANAVTRAGDNTYHLNAYWYLKNEALNSADFADNLTGAGRTKDKEHRFGFQAGGRLIRDRLFFSSALEQFNSHGTLAPQTFFLPTTNYLPAYNIPSTRLAYQLLKQYPGPVIDALTTIAPLEIAAPVVVNRTLALERGDYSSKSGKDRIMARLVLDRFKEPDFSYSPYPDFITPLYQNTTGIAGNWTRSWTPRLTHELKLNYSDDNLWWDRAHPEIPTLASGDQAYLPGSPLFYSYRNRNRSFEAIYSAVWTRRRHVITAGGGMLLRFNSGHLTAGQDGEYLFANLFDFAFDAPSTLYAAVDKFTGATPDYDRAYRYAQSYFFVQDSFRFTPHLTLNFGLRYERFGSPRNTGMQKDAILQLGSGADFNARLASATLVRPANGSGDQLVYGADNLDFAPRFGFSWDPFGHAKTIVRGGYGLFYDAPFDNLWQNVRGNNILLPSRNFDGSAVDYLQPVSGALPQGPFFPSNFPPLTVMDPRLRSGYSQDFFLGVQQQVRDNLSVEINGTGNLGRRLITTDIVNRQFTLADDFGNGRPNESLADISWRSGQGKSDYYALSTLVKYRLRSIDFQAAYTYSHAIDNQSDALIGDFFNLDFTAITGAQGTKNSSTFARMFDSSGDRANADSDQRHNLFLMWDWRSPSRSRIFGGWKFAGLAAFRSGFPYSVLSATTMFPTNGNGLTEDQRADLILPGNGLLPRRTPVPGGVQILNPAAFAEPIDPGIVGNTGRNAFRGPGLYNSDISVSRTFSMPWFGEGSRLTFRADAFNVLNHANLNNPDNLLGSPTFGIANYGRQGAQSGFPAVAPLNETARQIQLLVRVEF
jgi:outer membrane receptor protein involved in Fe transport